MSPAVKSKVRALAPPRKTVARAVPEAKYSHSSACRIKSEKPLDDKMALAYVGMPMKLP